MGSTACRAVVGNPVLIGKLKFLGLTPVCGTACSRHVAACLRPQAVRAASRSASQVADHAWGMR